MAGTIEFARRMDRMRPSTIREILKAASRPDIISLAGGLPAPELFPVEEMREACTRTLRDMGPQALQYGESEGYYPLREYIAAEMGRRGIACEVSEVLLTTGSQQALDLVGRVLLNPGDVVLTENPTYLAAIQAFQGFEASFVPVPTDEDGIMPEALPELIQRHRPKLLYAIPTFQNPTGVTLTAARRKLLYEVAAEHRLLVVEDDPYGRLRYRGADIPPIRALGRGPEVVYISTFSKTIAPGLRLGWLVASSEILAKLIVAKQASDLHTSSFNQAVVYRYLQDFDNEAHVERVRAAYGERFLAMEAALRSSMPEGFSWTRPDGGMFLWVTGPSQLDTTALLQLALSHRVLFVPGCDFFPSGGESNHMRLNFSNAAPDRIREGISRLGRCAEEVLLSAKLSAQSQEERQNVPTH